eukprot:CAMPEP_0115068214 /NCGR_PEP_ID=MMETSP0227-20121206/11840_1 /TAXON_ID=89957 /ORGANISM="Polarella glacialis, Strain CCMP 1383" /LENGTH=716 /DNA_ID=CAMNT_0002454405 /DNA_START=132 /DNA_END=2280 /DNA_ORIENTATION=-
MPLPSLPDFPQLVRRKSNAVLPEGAEIPQVQVAVGTGGKLCWGSDEGGTSARAAGTGTLMPLTDAADGLGASGEASKRSMSASASAPGPLNRSPSTSSASAPSQAKLRRTPRQRSFDVQAFDREDVDRDSSGDEAGESSGPRLQGAIGAAATPPRRPSSSSRSRAAVNAVMALRGYEVEVGSSAPAAPQTPRSARPQRPPERSSTEATPSASPAAPQTPGSALPQRPPERSSTAETPRGSMLRQLTPRRLVPRLWLSKGPEGPQTPSRSTPAASLPANVPTPSRSRGSLSARNSREADAPASVASAALSQRTTPAPETQSSELAETELLTRKLLEAAYEQSLGDEQASVVLGICPEVSWLVQCTLGSPLPPGWRKRSNGSYLHSDAGTTSLTTPVVEPFAKLARLALHARQTPDSASTAAAARQTPDSASTAAAWVRKSRDDALRDALQLQDDWSGPHLDRSAGAEYYHCVATGVSTWSNPSAPATYLAHVADRLLQSDAFPVNSGEEPSLEEVAAGIQTARQAKHSARPQPPKRPASAAAGTSSSSRAPTSARSSGGSSNADAAAALAGAAAAVAAAAQALASRGQGSSSSSSRGLGETQANVEALAKAAAALHEAAGWGGQEKQGKQGPVAEKPAAESSNVLDTELAEEPFGVATIKFPDEVAAAAAASPEMDRKGPLAFDIYSEVGDESASSSEDEACSVPSPIRSKGGESAA